MASPKYRQSWLFLTIVLVAVLAAIASIIIGNVDAFPRRSLTFDAEARPSRASGSSYTSTDLGIRTYTYITYEVSTIESAYIITPTYSDASGSAYSTAGYADMAERTAEAQIYAPAAYTGMPSAKRDEVALGAATPTAGSSPTPKQGSLVRRQATPSDTGSSSTATASTTPRTLKIRQGRIGVILKITYLAIAVIIAVELITLACYLFFHTRSLQRQAAADERDGLSQPLAPASTANPNTPGEESGPRNAGAERKVVIQGARAHSVFLAILDVLLLGPIIVLAIMISTWNTPSPLSDVLMRGDDGYEVGQYILGVSEYCTSGSSSYYNLQDLYSLDRSLCPSNASTLQQQFAQGGFAYWNGPYVAVLTLLCTLFLLTGAVAVLVWQRHDTEGMIGAQSTPLFFQPHFAQALQMHRAAAQQQHQQQRQDGTAPALFMAEVGPDGRPRWGPHSYFANHGSPAHAPASASQVGGSSPLPVQPLVEQQRYQQDQPQQQHQHHQHDTTPPPEAEPSTSKGKGKARAIDPFLTASEENLQAQASTSRLPESQHGTAI